MIYQKRNHTNYALLENRLLAHVQMDPLQVRQENELPTDRILHKLIGIRLQAHQICKGLGVEEDHIRSYIPLRKNHDEALKILREEIEYEGVSVIIPHRECVRTLERKHKMKAKIKKMK